MRVKDRLQGLVFEPPPIGTVLYLPGLPGDGSRIYDRSPYGNQGTITGAVWTRLPSGLWVLSFDGIDDKVTITNAPSLNITDELTIEFWVKSTTVGWGYGIGKPVITNNPTNYRFYTIDQNLRFHYFSTIHQTYATGNVITAGWQQVVVAMKFTISIVIYRNGVALSGTWSEGDGTAVGIANTQNLLIDRAFNTTCKADQIGLVRIYNRTLSATEIASHYNQERRLFGV